MIAMLVLAAQLPAVPAGAQTVVNADYSRDYRIDLDFHPVAPVVPGGKLRMTGLIPLRPIGFRADELGFSFNPTYGLGDGWEATAGFQRASRQGPGDNAFFWGGGVQKQFAREGRARPALSIGGFGVTGPHDQLGGSLYLVGSKRLAGSGRLGNLLLAHAGVKLDAFNGDDYGDGAGVRPFVGVSSALRKQLFFTGELSPGQPWEPETVFSLRLTYRFHVRGHALDLTGGIGNIGYRTLPFFGVTF